MKKLFKIIITLGIIAVVALMCFSCYAGTYNKLVAKDEEVTAKWSEVQNMYQRRLDLIPNLVATVKGAASHEKETFEAVTEARAKAAGTINITADDLSDPSKFEAFQNAQNQLGTALGRLLAVSEAYPELKANQNFLSLQDELEGTENRITVARTRFNEAVKDYNVTIRSFPTNIIANMHNFEKKSSFTAAAEAQSAPKVEF